MTVVAGNVRERGFTEIWSTSPVLRNLRDRKKLKGRCGACEFNELCGGCRCRAQAAFGDYLQEDPSCTYQPTGQTLNVPDVLWTAEARARLERIPIKFIRDKVRKGLEAYAQRNDEIVISTKVMDDGLAGMDRPTTVIRAPDEATITKTPDWLA
jgi:radical SAM protein with 4Fe4S-binding SPASM domain